MISAYVSGLLVGFSLIIAIGAQNAFVLRQGLRREHVFVICLICSLSDALLILAGTLGAKIIAEQLPWFDPVMRIGGTLFLSIYGIQKLISVYKNQTSTFSHSNQDGISLTKAVLLCLAFTWLNPHVYIDTMVLVGSLSANYGADQIVFATGAMTASFIFFFSLGYGARLLLPLFSNPVSWRILDSLIGCLMLILAFGLVSTLRL